MSIWNVAGCCKWFWSCFRCRQWLKGHWNSGRTTLSFCCAASSRYWCSWMRRNCWCDGHTALDSLSLMLMTRISLRLRILLLRCNLSAKRRLWRINARFSWRRLATMLMMTACCCCSCCWTVSIGDSRLLPGFWGCSSWLTRLICRLSISWCIWTSIDSFTCHLKWNRRRERSNGLGITRPNYATYLCCFWDRLQNYSYSWLYIEWCQYYSQQCEDLEVVVKPTTFLCKTQQ